jgi:hypothetical protein
VPLSGVTVVDSDGTTLLGPISLAVGASAPYSGTITVAVGCGPFTDTVTATGTNACSLTPVTATAQCTTTVTTAPGIAVTKSCDPSIPFGTTTIHVNGTVSNTGNVPLSGVVVKDSDGTTLVGPISLAVGASAPYSGTTTVAVGCGPFTDTVTATGTNICTLAAVTATAQCTTTVTTAPAIAVTKSCDPSIEFGTTTIHVNGTVSNTGNVPLSGVTVVDSDGTTLVGPISLAVGASAPYSGTTTVAVGCGPFTDTVTATGTNICTLAAVTATAQCTTTVRTSPGIAVTKSCDPSIPFGTTTIHVNGTVSNTGDVPLSGVTVVDSDGTTLVGPISLAVGASAPYSGTITVAVGCGPFTDTVTATGTNICTLAPVTATARCTTTVTTAPAIAVTKSCDASIEYGTTTIHVNGTVSNTGNVPLNNVVVKDSDGTTLLTVPSLAVGASAPYTGTITVAVSCGPFTDTVTANGSDACTGNLVTANASCTTTVTTKPGIAVTKSCDSTIEYGTTTVHVNGTVSNTGDVPLNNVVVKDSDGTTLLTVPSLAVGASAPYTGTITVAVSCGPFTDTVTANGSDACTGNPVSANASCTTTVTTRPGIAVTKTCDHTIEYGTTTVHVSGTVSNTGDVPLNNVVVKDSDGTTLIGPISLAVGASAPYTGTITVPVSCGPFTDTVTANGADACTGNPVSANASCTTTVTTSPKLAVTKSCDRTIEYGTTTINVSGTVSNTGDVPLNNVVVKDSDGTTLLTVASLAVGASAPYTGTITVPVSCGPFTDTVTANGTDACTGNTVSANASCTTTVTTSPCISVTKTCPSQVPCGTTTITVSGVVSNCGDVPLSGIKVVDSDGTTLLTLDSLPVGGSAPYSGTVKLPARATGPVTDTVTASGKDSCTGKPVTANASCTTTVQVCPPQICVTKQVACVPQGFNGVCNDSIGSYGPTAVGVAGPNQQPAFCYKIVVTNCGQDVVTNLTISDPDLPGLTIPSSLAIGQSVTNFASKSWPVGSHTNTVTVSGVGASTGISACSTPGAVCHASAVAIVVPISLTCSIELFAPGIDMDSNPTDNHLLLPQDSAGTTLSSAFILTICNTGQAPMDVNVNDVLTGDMTLANCNFVDANGNVVAPVVGSDAGVLAPGQCTNIVCDIVLGANACPGPDTMTVTVTGTAVATVQFPCIYDKNGQPITASGQCNATVQCVPPVTCRTTGGGTMYNCDSNMDCVLVTTHLYPLTSKIGQPLDHVSHGGQLGAPFSQQDCAHILADQCIRGQWQHNRHFKGPSSPADVFAADFHTAGTNAASHPIFDTLLCACLGCCNPDFANIKQPAGNFNGWSKFKFQVCNPDDHKVCGPAPRPAPANALIWSGIGTYKPSTANGNKPATYAVLRVYVEDRSEPGGWFPKGSVSPADVYCFQAWDTGISVQKHDDPNNLGVSPILGDVNTFRSTLSADSCAFLKAISVNGPCPPGSLPQSSVLGIPAFVNDCGIFHTGNQQIHPSTGATCDAPGGIPAPTPGPINNPVCAPAPGPCAALSPAQ